MRAPPGDYEMRMRERAIGVCAPGIATPAPHFRPRRRAEASSTNIWAQKSGQTRVVPPTLSLACGLSHSASSLSLPTNTRQFPKAGIQFLLPATWESVSKIAPRTVPRTGVRVLFTTLVTTSGLFECTYFCFLVLFSHSPQ